MENEIVRGDMLVEVFSTRDIAKIQFSMNQFFKENPDIEIIELKYSHICDPTGEQIFTAMLVYK